MMPLSLGGEKPEESDDNHNLLPNPAPRRTTNGSVFMQLSNSFSLQELTASEVAIRKGIDNEPTKEQIVNLTELAMALDRVELLLGFPLHINSAFRSQKVNAAVGGSSTSAHLEGYAADFTSKGFGSPLEIARKIVEADTIAYDQIIQEGSWIHFSVDPRMRKQVLTAHFAGGKVSYTQGL